MVRKNLLFALVIVILSLMLSAGLDRLPQVNHPISSHLSTALIPATGSSTPGNHSIPLDRAPLLAKVVVIGLFLLALLISVAPLFIDQPDDGLIYSSK